MTPLVLSIIEVIICYVAMCILYKRHKLDGIYIYIIIATFISCLMNLKETEIMGINVPIGFGITTSVIISSNLITQKKGLGELKNTLMIIFITMLIGCCFLKLSSLIITPS